MIGGFLAGCLGMFALMALGSIASVTFWPVPGLHPLPFSLYMGASAALAIYGAYRLWRGRSRNKALAWNAAALLVGGVLVGVVPGVISRPNTEQRLASVATQIDTGPTSLLSSPDHIAGSGRELPRPNESVDQEELGIALVAAAGTNNVDAITALLAMGAPLDYPLLQRTPLIVAISERNEEAVLVLLEAGANPNYVSRFDWRPLHYAINAESASTNIIRQLIAHGADPNARTDLNIAPLHRAASFCHADAVRLLIELSGDPALLDNQGNTPAARAVLSGCPGGAALFEKTGP